jgi:hypothetical protein
MDGNMVAMELVAVARELLGYARAPVDPGVELRKDITPVLRRQLGLEGNAFRANPKFSKFLLYTDSKDLGGSSDSNKFHYFAIYERQDGSYVGGNAWGALGYPATYRAMELGRGDSRSVETAVRSKLMRKLSKGYEETRFAA